MVAAGTAAERVDAHVSRLPDAAAQCHAWSADGKCVAVGSGAALVVLALRGGAWAEEARLPGAHEQRITAVDWHGDADNGRILTASADRNAYVWTRRGGSWTPTLVLLRLRRGATCARWSPDGARLAVGGAEGVVSVGAYDAESDWWACKHVRRPLDGGAVLSLAWHADGARLAVTTLAGNMHVVGADDSAGASMTYSAGAWLHDVSFSPAGDAAAAAGHDGAVHLVRLSGPPAGQSDGAPARLSGERVSLGFPVRCVCFVGASLAAASGFDVGCGPVLLAGGRVACAMAPGGDSASAPAPAGDAFAKFRALDAAAPGRAPACAGHANGICEMRVRPGGELSTTAADGTHVLWRVDALATRLRLSAL